MIFFGVEIMRYLFCVLIFIRSGGYFNPAITLGLVITQTIRVPLAVGYVVAQVLGGMLGAALARVSMTQLL